MALIPISLELEYYNDPNSYKPLDAGNLYIGQPNTDPEVLTNRITVTLRQEDGSEVPLAPAQQPFPISPGGRVTYNGSVVQILADQSYSLKVTDDLGGQKYYISKAGQVLDTPIPPAADEWTEGTTPIYIGPTSFSVEGNQTATYHKGRRVRSNNTSGIAYSTIDNSSFDGSKTTVVLENTSGVLDLGLSAVAYGINSSINSSVPGDLSDLREIILSKKATTPKAQIGINLLDPPLTGGTNIAYTLVMDETAYQAERIYQVRIHVDNDGACTLDIDGIGATNIKTKFGSDPAGGELKAGMIANFRYDATDFIILNPAIVTTEQIGNGAVSREKIQDAVTGTLIVAASDAEAFRDGTLIKLKEIYVPYGGTFSVYFELKSNNASFLADAQIWVNDAAAGTYRQTTSTTYVPFIEDIIVNPGNLVQIYAGRSGGSAIAAVQNFRIREDKPGVFSVIS